MAWVTPEEYFGPDFNPTNLYAAMGRAIATWEEVEHFLAILYTAYGGVAGGVLLLDEYGDFLTSSYRISNLKIMAQKHFVTNPSQELESRHDEIISLVEILIRKRHQIAHGIVGTEMDLDGKTLNGWQPPLYGVMPTWHGAKSLAKGLPYRRYCHRVRHLEGFTEEFEALKLKVIDLIRLIAPDYL